MSVDIEKDKEKWRRELAQSTDLELVNHYIRAFELKFNVLNELPKIRKTLSKSKTRSTLFKIFTAFSPLPAIVTLISYLSFPEGFAPFWDSNIYLQILYIVISTVWAFYGAYTLKNLSELNESIEKLRTVDREWEENLKFINTILTLQSEEIIQRAEQGAELPSRIRSTIEKYSSEPEEKVQRILTFEFKKHKLPTSFLPQKALT